MQVFAVIILAFIIVICLLISELVKQSKLLAMYDDELTEAQREIQRLKAKDFNSRGPRRSQGGGKS